MNTDDEIDEYLCSSVPSVFKFQSPFSRSAAQRGQPRTKNSRKAATSLFNLHRDRGAHLLRQFLAADGFEMDVSGFDEELRWEGRGEGVQVIDGNAVPSHDLGSHLIVAEVIPHLTAGLALGDQGSVGKDELRPGLLEALDDGFQIRLILLQCNGEGAIDLIPVPIALGVRVAVAKVVQAGVEVNDIPLGVCRVIDTRPSQPAVEGLQVSGGGSAVYLGAADIGLARKRLNNQRGVSYGDGVSKDQYLG